MNNPFDSLIGILHGHQPPTTWQVLGVREGECDPHRLEEAALRQVGRVRPFQLAHPVKCTRLLNAIARALNQLSTERKPPDAASTAVSSNRKVAKIAPGAT